MTEDPPPGYLGADARIRSGPAPELIEAGYELELAEAPLLWRGLGRPDLAHARRPPPQPRPRRHPGGRPSRAARGAAGSAGRPRAAGHGLALRGFGESARAPARGADRQCHGLAERRAVAAGGGEDRVPARAARPRPGAPRGGAALRP